MEEGSNVVILEPDVAKAFQDMVKGDLTLTFVNKAHESMGH